MTKNSESTSNSTNVGCGLLLLMLFLEAIGVTALQSFLYPPSHRYKEPEPKQYVSSMNRAQQAKFAENNTFANSVNDLGLVGIKTETTNFKYSVTAKKQAAFNYGVSKNEKYKSYTGGVFVIRRKQNNAPDEITTEGILCVAEEAGTLKPIPPKIQNSRLVCGDGTTEVTK